MELGREGGMERRKEGRESSFGRIEGEGKADRCYHVLVVVVVVFLL